MPRGHAGTFTHGASAYRNGWCRCDYCTSEHARIRRLEREIGSQPANGGRFVRTDEGVTALVSPTERKVLDALLFDGADTETIGRRVGVSESTVRRQLGSIQHGLGFPTRIAMVVAMIRGHAGYREVRSTTDDETSPARRRKGA